MNKLLRRGIIKRIHVNMHVIRANLKDGTDEAVLTVKTSNDNDKGHEVDILDRDGNVVASVVYRPENRLSCGATVWITTRNEVIVRTREGGESEAPA
jgi:hypothetical protein